MATKAGFVSIVGRPNVGKSSLLNRLIGQKIAGVSPKPQTTRQTIRGILTEKQGQIVFLDTPGLHTPKDQFNERMVSAAKTAYLDSDLIYWMVFPAFPKQEEMKILEDLKATGKPIFLLINKIDTTAKPNVLPVLDAYHKLYPFKNIFPISVLNGDNLKELLDHTFQFLPEGAPFFPEDITSDQTERFIVSEMIREKVFRFTVEEIPYASAVEITDFKERENGVTFIEATIFVERDSQKRIIIGSKGDAVKRIGTAARQDIEMLLGKKVFLQLWVKAKEDWKTDGGFLKRIEGGESE